MSSTLDEKYSKWEHVEEYEMSEDEMDAMLSESELKAKREKKRDELIQKELDGYKEIDEKLKRAEKLPKRVADDYEEPKGPTSWSSGRESKKIEAKNEDAWRAVEALLSSLASDEDFQRDMKRPSFDKALRHWTNEKRLPPDEAHQLFDEDSFEFRQFIKPGLAKLSRLQAACRAAGIGVPVDALREGRGTVFKKKPPSQPKPLTEEEKKAIEKERERKARKDFEDRIMADLPPREPFSWKKFARQLALQVVLLGCAMIYFHFYMKPDIEKKIAQAADSSSNEDEFRLDDDEIVEIGSH